MGLTLHLDSEITLLQVSYGSDHDRMYHAYKQSRIHEDGKNKRTSSQATILNKSRFRRACLISESHWEKDYRQSSH